LEPETSAQLAAAYQIAVKPILQPQVRSITNLREGRQTGGSNDFAGRHGESHPELQSARM
jgi:hypothetical protein